jgi:uncharacterized OB-fold protein
MSASTTIWTSDPPSLLASRNTATRALRFPPLPGNSPLGSAHETVSIGTSGRVYSYTILYPNPKTGGAPFVLGYVDMEGPVRLFGRIAGEVAIGAECEAAPDPDHGYCFHVKAVR